MATNTQTLAEAVALLAQAVRTTANFMKRARDEEANDGAAKLLALVERVDQLLAGGGK